MAKAKKISPVFRYFVPFGMRQISDLLILTASVLIIVGLAVDSQVVVVVGLACYILASLIALYRYIRVLSSGINKKSPEYKSSFINLIFMVAILVVSIFALFMGIYWYYG